MKRIRVALAGLASVILLSGCEFAKPTDIDRLDGEIDRLEGELSSMTDTTNNMSAQVDSLSRATSDMSAQLDSLSRATSNTDANLDSLSRILLKLAILIGDASIVSMGNIGNDAVVEGTLLLESAAHLYFLSIESEVNIEIEADFQGDGLFSIMSKGDRGWQRFAQLDNDLSSNRAGYFDRSLYSDTITPGEYAVVVTAFFFEDSPVDYRLSVSVLTPETGLDTLILASEGTPDTLALARSVNGEIVEDFIKASFEDLQAIVILLWDDSPRDGTGGAVLFEDEFIITYEDATVDRGTEIPFEPIIEGGFERAGFLAADGTETIALTYDFNSSSFVNGASAPKEDIEEIEFLFLLANDYFVTVFFIYPDTEVGGIELGELEPESMFWAPGNIQDLSNLAVIRIRVGKKVQAALNRS